METQLYEKVHDVWYDRPNKTTPCNGADLMHFEQGIYDNSANIKKLAESGFVTKAVNDLENYYKKSETYTKEEVAALIAEVNKYSVVTELPTENISTSTIYLAPAEDAKTGNIYNEYLYVNGNWEAIGNTAIDLSGYLTTTGDASNTTVTFEQAAQKSNIQSGDSLAVAFGKLAKFCADFPSLTTSLSVNVEGVSALDGTVGKVLNDKIAVNADAITQINSDLNVNRIDTVGKTIMEIVQELAKQNKIVSFIRTEPTDDAPFYESWGYTYIIIPIGEGGYMVKAYRAFNTISFFQRFTNGIVWTDDAWFRYSGNKMS